MILIHNAKIFTNEENEDIFTGYVIIDNNKIKEVSKGSFKKKISFSRIIDARGNLLMPGLVNAHSHLYSTFARGFNFNVNPKSFKEILEQIWWKLDNTLKMKDIYFSALIGGIEFLQNGITTIIDHHSSPNEIPWSLFTIKEAIIDQLGLRANLSYEISDRYSKKQVNEAINENFNFYHYSKIQPNRVSASIGLHALFTIQDDTLKEVAKKLNQNNVDAGIHIHVAEGPEDEKINKEKYNLSVIERLEKFNLLNNKSLLIHGIHLSEKEIEIIKKYNSIVVINQQSNINNKVGVVNLPLLFKNNILIGIGNDGFGFNLFDEVKAIALFQNFNSNPITYNDIFNMLFKNNYEIANRLFSIKIGKIKPDYLADIIILNYKTPTQITKDNLISHIIFGFSKNIKVLYSIINGNLIIDRGCINTIDIDSIYKKAQEVSKQFWQKLKKAYKE